MYSHQELRHERRRSVHGNGDRRASMRMLLKVRPQGDQGNKAIVDGTFGRVLGRFMERFHPEATYFTTENGERTALLIFDLKSESEMVTAAEPFWNEMHATVDWSPVMNAEDVQKGLAALGK
jgi:hypothetical protein